MRCARAFILLALIAVVGVPAVASLGVPFAGGPSVAVGQSLRSAPADNARSHEDDSVKAAFLYRFTSYVDWPESALKSPRFTIAVLGNEGVASQLQRLLPNRRIKDRPARVVRIKDLHELGNAQILYVGPARLEAVRASLARLAARPVLIVSDEEHGLDEGSAVNFVLEDRHVRFEISLEAAQRCHLKISSELLSVASRVQGARTPGLPRRPYRSWT